MNIFDMDYHWKNLEMLDPDQLVSDLNLSSEQILERFRDEAIEFIEDNFG